MATEYQAGKCNIGKQEVRYRKRIVGYGAGLVSTALYVMLVFFNVPIGLYAVLVVPVFICVHGLNEARYAFCTSYGRTGRYNMTSEPGITQDVLSQSKRRLDREYAAGLTRKSFLTTFLITAGLIAAARFIN